MKNFDSSRELVDILIIELIRFSGLNRYIVAFNFFGLITSPSLAPTKPMLKTTDKVKISEPWYLKKGFIYQCLFIPFLAKTRISNTYQQIGSLYLNFNF